MKGLSIVLAAGVVAGLIVYAILQAQNWIGLVGGDLVTLHIPTFVATLAGVGFGSAALALGFRRAFAVEEQHTVRHLEERIAQLERTARATG